MEHRASCVNREGCRFESCRLYHYLHHRFIAGLGVGIGVPPGLGVGHGFDGSSGVQGVGAGVGVAKPAACTVDGLSSQPEVIAIPANKYATEAAIIIAMVVSESAFVLSFESMEPPLSELLSKCGHSPNKQM